jgi:hypothetical protein
VVHLVLIPSRKLEIALPNRLTAMEMEWKPASAAKKIPQVHSNKNTIDIHELD